MIKKNERRIPPIVYTRDYFLSDHCDGFKEFKERFGLSFNKAKALEMLRIEPETKILDIGCGRGELLYHCGQRGARLFGIDYSIDAIDITKEVLKEFGNAKILLGDCRSIPFSSNLFDRVVAIDLIEHMNYRDGLATVQEINRVLKPGSFALIYTSPNRIFVNIVYPIVKVIFSLWDRDASYSLQKHMYVADKVHIQHYDFFLFKKLSKDVGICSNVWVDRDVFRSGENRFTETIHKSLIGRSIRLLLKIFPLHLILGNDIWMKFYK
ncbi:hypothetical protein LCGC14_0800190 [marine sediment metagenome]|uniref:Methyltransferase domain-containing protein n=1 Tax=marine sediment metagenome TaxID=412755 RepID=A0A0F9S9X8_9ZZZZ